MKSSVYSKLCALQSQTSKGDHANACVGAILHNRYCVVRDAGIGNFARVYECVTVGEEKERVAVKLLKRGLDEDATSECEVLRSVARLDQEDQFGIVKLKESFSWNGHPALVFPLKGRSLASRTLPLRREEVGHVAFDVAKALSFLHSIARAVHTDLKTENILEECRCDRCSPNERRYCICDLGSSSFFSDVPDTDLITTRPYRAPEVILSRGWSYPADTWSFGCILYELCCGKTLFTAVTDAEHLFQMQQRLGPLPASMQTTKISAPHSSCPLPTLEEELRDDPLLLSLLRRMLEYDPAKRIECVDVLHHPFTFHALRGTKTVPPVQLQATTSYATVPLTATPTSTPSASLGPTPSSPTSPVVHDLEKMKLHSSSSVSPLPEGSLHLLLRSPPPSLAAANRQPSCLFEQ